MIRLATMSLATKPCRLAFTLATLFASTAIADPLGDLDALFPREQAVRLIGRDVTPPSPPDAEEFMDPGKEALVPITALRLERGFPELQDEDRDRPEDAERDEVGGRKRRALVVVSVTYGDAGRNGAPKRFFGVANCYADSTSQALRCNADTCDGGHLIVDREADGGAILHLP